MEVGTGFDSWEEFSTVFSLLIWSEKWKVLISNDIKTDFSCSISIEKMVCTSLIWNISIQRSNEWLNLLMALIFSLMGIKNKHCHTIKYLCFLERISNFESYTGSVNRYFTDLAWRMILRSDYSPRSGANSYKAGNDDVFSLFHAETD